MRVINLCCIFIIIEVIAADIHLEGDCDLSEVFVNSADYPDWSSCLAFKNQSDECGKEELKDQRDEYPRLYSPVKAYERIISKNHWLEEYPPTTGNVEYYASKDYPCIIDDFVADRFSTYNSENQSIKFNSDTVQNNTDYYKYYGDQILKENQGITTCAWIYGASIGSFRYDLKIEKFEIPECNDCSCGFLDIYEATYRNATLLKRLCSHNITETLSFESWYHDTFKLLIHFQTNVTTPKKLEIDVSSSPISEFDKWTQCNVECGEGFQTRQLINTEKCTATQFRSCWVGRCSDGESATLEFSSNPVNNECLNKMQEAQENFHSKRTQAGKLCGYFSWDKFLATAGFVSLKARKLLKPKSQLNKDGCKPNATEECKVAFLDYISTLSDLADNDDLKSCYNPIMVAEGPGDNRFNDFLFFTKAVEYDYKNYDYTDYDVILTMKDYLKPYFDKWTSSCQLD